MTLSKPKECVFRSSPVARPERDWMRDQVMRLPEPGKEACHVGVRGMGERCGRGRGHSLSEVELVV